MINKHKYGQHYTPKILTDKYVNLFKKLKEKKICVVDPFVGEGNLLLEYLSQFSKEEAIELLKEKKIKGFDIDKKTLERTKKRFKDIYDLDDELLKELFIVNNSLKTNKTKIDDFILTNPPYLARNVCKKKYPKDFKKNFENNKFKDYYEIALNKYKKNEGFWIIPTNFITSEYLTETRKKLFNVFNFKNINVFEFPIFKDTRISVISFHLKYKKEEQDELNINFVKEDSEKEIKISLTEKGEICSDWLEETTCSGEFIKQGLLREQIPYGEIELNVLNEDYVIEKIKTTKEMEHKLKNNILFLRATDTGSKTGVLGLYTLNELFKNNYSDLEPVSLVTKKTSRLCVPLFFLEDISIEEQLKIKDLVNKKLKKYREKYHSVFLTNFKNTTNKISRKRISFKEIYGLIEKSIIEIKKEA